MAVNGRPVGVTIVAVLAIIVGVLQIIGSIAQFAGLGAPTPGSLLWLGILYLVIGLVTVAVGVGLLRGNPVARLIATVVFVIGLITDVITLITAPSQAWVAIIGGLLRVIALVLLYTKPANEFFRR